MTTILVTALLINCQVEQVSKRGLSSLLLSYTYALFFFSFLLQQDTKIYTNVVPTFFSNFFLKFLIFFFWNVMWGGVGVLIIMAACASK